MRNNYMAFKKPTQALGLLGAWLMLGAWSSDTDHHSISSPPALADLSLVSNKKILPIFTSNNYYSSTTPLFPATLVSQRPSQSGDRSILIVEEEEDNFAVLQAITLTVDNVILHINGQQTAAELILDPRTNRLALVVEGVKLADSIPINQDNAGPDGTLMKRRLKIKQLDRGVVEVSLNAQEQSWAVRSHSQGLLLAPMAIASTEETLEVEVREEVSQGELSAEETLMLSEATAIGGEGAEGTSVETTVTESSHLTQTDKLEIITGPIDPTFSPEESTTEIIETAIENDSSQEKIEVAQTDQIETTEVEIIETETLDSVEFIREQGAEESPQKQPEITTPLLRQPLRLLHLPTANQLLQGQVLGTFGQTQTFGGPGTGNQTYFIYADWGLINDLQVGWSFMYNDDPTYNAVNGSFIEQLYQSTGPNLKYNIYSDENWGIGVLGSIEQFQIYSGPGLFNNATSPTLSRTVAGTVQLPISYNLSEQFQVTFTPAVNIFSDSLNSVPFYGTVFSVGLGANWRVSEQLSLFGNTVVPLSGGNSINTSREISKTPIWSFGASYAFSKAVGFELSLTNAFGGTPATGVLTLPTAANEILLGAQFKIAPLGKEVHHVDYTDRQKRLLFDWFTLTTPYVFPTDDFGIRFTADTGGSVGGGIFYSVLQNFQMELLLSSIGGFDTQSVIDSSQGTATQWRLGGKLLFLNQADGDPLSISGRLTGGRDISEAEQGYFMLEFPFMYEVNNQLALLFSPKAAITGGKTPVGLGLGANYQISPVIQLIAEVTPLVTGERLVWSAGLRLFPLENLAIDLMGTNATSQLDLGELLAEPGTRFSAGIQWRFGQGSSK
ncbi:hypothetical protein IQ217_11100 [Synechocystis salina LEGE 00031]|uniref:Uncharacterized protein n=2 Tax=Synechocystis TaxID=1142 RepID=A0ABR9VV83_9SYNC|nr:hypothetical protein [Synechocystis salina LEGE 00041]MBE9254378.1 hypothetical protein [Synechocystis salina LEGE 00031]